MSRRAQDANYPELAEPLRPAPDQAQPDDTELKLSRLGFWMLYGSDRYRHIVRRNRRGSVTRGQRALCGHTAQRHDINGERDLCAECMRLCMAEVSPETAPDPAPPTDKPHALFGDDREYLCSFDGEIYSNIDHDEDGTTVCLACGEFITGLTSDEFVAERELHAQNMAALNRLSRRAEVPAPPTVDEQVKALRIALSTAALALENVSGYFHDEAGRAAKEGMAELSSHLGRMATRHHRYADAARAALSSPATALPPLRPAKRTAWADLPDGDDGDDGMAEMRASRLQRRLA